LRCRRADRAALVDRLADDVDDAAERLGADRHRDLRAGVDHFLAAGEAVGRVHRDRAHGVLAEVLGDFEHQAVAVVVGLERGEDRRQLAFEGHVDDGADDLADAAEVVGCTGAFGGQSLLVAAGFGAAVAIFVPYSSSFELLERFGAER
jgi:hypothetical protein